MDFSILTRLLNIRREFWHIGDIVLPTAVPVVPAGVALAVLFLEFQVGQRLHLNLSGLPSPLPLLLPFLLPWLGWWLAGKPEIEGLPIERFLLIQFRFVFAEPRTVIHFEGAWEPRRIRFQETAFEEFS